MFPKAKISQIGRAIRIETINLHRWCSENVTGSVRQQHGHLKLFKFFRCGGLGYLAFEPVEDTWLITVEGAEILNLTDVATADTVVSIILVDLERLVDNGLVAETSFVSGEDGPALLPAKTILGPLFGWLTVSSFRTGSCVEKC